MLRKDHFLLTAIIAMFSLQTASAQGNYQQNNWSSSEMRYRNQGYDMIDSAYIPAGRMKQHREFLAHNYVFPAKPRNMWEIGVGAGLYNILGDVPGLAPWQKGGFGIHGHVRKAWGYVISNRIQYNYGIAKGMQWQESRNYRFNPAWNQHYYAAGNPEAVGTEAIHYNYRMESHQLNFDAIATANNIRFHKARSFWVAYGFIGVGALAYKTYVNSLNADGNAYNYCEMVTVPQIYENKNEITKALQNGMDNSYETAAESEAGRGRAEFGKRGVGGVAKTLLFAPSVGAGIQVRLSRHVNISLEDRLTIPYNDDLIDGQRWAEQVYGSAALTGQKDIVNYLGLGFNVNLGGRRSIEPLYWMNPMVYVYSQLSSGDRVQMPEMELPDADFDGITDQFDLCPGTPAGVAVDAHGCPLDTDGDMVPDFRDKQLITPTECQPVDVDGIGKCPCPEGCDPIVPPVTGCENIIPGSVSFRRGSSELTNSCKRQLDNLADQLRGQTGCDVILKTYPKALPHDGSSERRARKRLENAVEYLKYQGGIEESRIKTQLDEYMDKESDVINYEPVRTQ
jgi:hypothetical protein